MIQYIPPKTISEELHYFKCGVNEIYTMKIQRGEDGEVDYLSSLPDRGLIICAVECLDGAILVMWEE